MTVTPPIGHTNQAEQACAPGKEPEVMALLLEEYRALRAEFGQRVAARVQLLGFAGILSAVLAAAGGFRFDAQNLYVGWLLP
ncbi:hypothetical protein [Streptomyces sp. NPDC000618]|uniref:hypothetical protein n=1 Tax=Streptomyces sp. NPDC000618 TaxID=3154265 RepID=UPI003333779C